MSRDADPDLMRDLASLPDVTTAELDRFHGYASFWTPDPGDDRSDDGTGRAVRTNRPRPRPEPVGV